MKEILIYIDKNGNEPYTNWIDSVSIDYQAKASAYITRVALGGCKNNIKSLKDGIFEIKIDYGSGIRIYFGEDGKRIIILLTAGDKKTQNQDIKKAKEYWREYETNKKFQ